MELGEEAVRLVDRLAFQHLGHQRGGGGRDRAAAALEADIGDLVAVDREIDRDPVAAQRVVAARQMRRVFERVEIARVPAVVEDDVLVQLAQIVTHLEHLPAGLDRRRQAVDIGLVVVDAERGAHRAGEPELFHQRLGAMVADPHRHIVLVEHGADIVRVHPLDIEGKHAEPPLPARHHVDARDARHEVDGVAGQRLLVVADRLAADLLDEIDGQPQPDRAGDVRGAGLEAVRRLLEVGVVDLDIEDHAAAGLPGRHRLQHIVAAVQHAGAGRAISLVPGEQVEIAAERPHVDRHPRHRLAAVDQHLGALGVRQFDDALDRQPRAGHVGDMRHRDDAGAGRQHRLEGAEVELAGIVGRGHQQFRADPVAQYLPRHDVRVVLDIADDDLVAGFQVRRAPALGHQVDRLGGAAQKNDLALVGGVEEGAHLLARRLEMVGRALAQLVDAAMHVGDINVPVHI